MKRVVFCEIAWMNYYQGNIENDKPMRGGKYIDENGQGGEIYNFLPFNHHCYGYVMHYGNEMHIERYDKVAANHSEVNQMTVVWVATDGVSRKIVGWYENATMYREWQAFFDPKYSGSEVYDYSFKADEKDCYLIDKSKRCFEIPSAPKAGKGRGMGQSQVWYADSEYAQETFIPKVLEYLEKAKQDTVPIGFTEKDIRKVADVSELKGQSYFDAINEGFSEDRYKGLAIANLAVKDEESYEAYRIRGDVLATCGLHKEALEDFKKAMFLNKTPEVMADVMYLEKLIGSRFVAITLGEELRAIRNQDEWWIDDAVDLFCMYLEEGLYDKAKDLYDECVREKDIYHFTFLEDGKEDLATLAEMLKTEKK